jgi:hypothetical protein
MLMEWVLQVADEVDDALSAARLFALGWGDEIGVLVAGSAVAWALWAVLRAIA